MAKSEKTEIEQIQFFHQCFERFEHAAEVTGKVYRYYNIAETCVCLCFAGEAMIPYMTPALEHLRIAETSNPDMTIHVWDTMSTKIEMPPPPCEWADFTDRGDIWGFNSKRIKTAFHWSEYSVNVMDIQTNKGVYWVKNPKAFPYWVYSSPFRSMIQWWMEKNNCQLLHAAAVGTKDGAVIITGKGGVGKSTTAITSLNAGLFYLSDDYVIVKKGDKPKVYSLYSTAKLKMEDMPKFPALQRFAGRSVEEDQEKAVLFLYPELQDQLKREMPLKAILTPEIKNQETSEILPTSFWPIQRAMSFTTMSQLPGVGSHTHEYISELTKQLPCYTIGLGRNLNEIPKVIANLLKEPENFGVWDNETTDIESPLITIVMPVFNGERFIRESIENILNQNYPAIEIIIVDDGSTDNSKKIIEELPIDVRYFHQPNAGPAAARNRGIRDVSGDYIAFLDVDDLWPEKNLELLMKHLQQNPELDIVRGYAQLINVGDDGKITYIGNPKESFPDYIGAALYRKSVFSTVGLYDPELRFGEDGDWFNRALEMNTKIKRLDEVTLYVRRHEHNMTEGKNLVELNMLKIFKKKLERQREQKPTETEPSVKTVGNENDLISIIIPVYNGAAFLADAIKSVLNQHYHPLEIIVVDDGSTDKTAEVVKMTDAKINYVFQENSGPASARNKGIAMAKGKYLAFLDADDIWSENKLNRQIELMNNNTTVGGVIGSIHQMPLSMEMEQAISNSAEKGMFMMSLGSSLFRKSSFKKVGNFDVDMFSGEDIDWFFRAREAGMHILIHKDVVLYFRKHGKNISNDRKTVNTYLLKAYKKSINRRKESGKNTTIKFPKLDNVEEVMKFWQSND